jgi:hypothetical protein
MPSDRGENQRLDSEEHGVARDESLLEVAGTWYWCSLYLRFAAHSSI